MPDPAFNSPQQLSDYIGKGGEVEVIDAPTFYASSLNIGLAGNDLTINFGRPVPITLPGRSDLVGAKLQTVAILNISVQTAKDFVLVLRDVLTEYEKSFGEVTTEFTQRRTAEGKPV